MKRMKLHEEFKLFENLWEEISPVERAREIRAEIARLKQELANLDLEEIDTSSIEATVPGTSKKLEKKGVSNQEALEALINFINGLSSEEKLAVYFFWCEDDLVRGDGKGEALFNKDSGDDALYDNTWLATAPVPTDTYDRIAAALGLD